VTRDSLRPATNVVGDVIAIAAERLGPDATAVLSRLGSLTVAATPARAGRAEILAAARSPIPASLRAVHPTWIEHALSHLTARARTALATPSDDPVDVWLARWATHELPPTVSDERLPAIAAMNDAAVVVAWLGRIGADQMAFALGDAAESIPALAAAIARIGKPPRLGELGPKRAAIARCRDVSLDEDLSFVLVGCRALAPHLATNQLAKLELILRLPRPIGIVVARELALHAATSFDQCPSWAAIDAQ
jgi:hypothetical protein